MQVKKNGVTVKEGETMDSVDVSVVEGDLFECPECGHQIISNFGKAHFISKGEWDKIPDKFKFVVK